MSKKTLALIITLLILTIVLLLVAVYTQQKPKQTTQNQPSKEQTTKVTPTPNPADTTLTLSPNPVYPASTGTASATTVDVRINTGKNNISAVQLEMQYDPAVLTGMKIIPGDFFKNPNVLPIGGVNQQTGRITFAVSPASIRESQSGTGIVAKLQFYPRATAGVTESEITLLKESLVTQLGEAKSVLKETQSTRVVLPLPNR